MGKPSVTKNALNAQLKKGYPTINNKLVQIKKGYITKGGKWQQCFSGDIVFSYTGRYEIVGDLSGRWELALLSSGNLTFMEINSDKVQVFLVGGGSTGGKSGNDSPLGNDIRVWGGDGGDGGKCYTTGAIPIELDTAYPVEIGEPGNSKIPLSAGKPSTVFGQTSASGNFRKGGKSAEAGHYGYDGVNAQPGKDGFLAFGEEDTIFQPGHKYGASASGAGSGYYSYQYGEGDVKPPGKAAATDGTRGGKWSAQANISAGGSAPENSGNGSGGFGTDGVPGTPGSGIIIIRPVL